MVLRRILPLCRPVLHDTHPRAAPAQRQRAGLVRPARQPTLRDLSSVPYLPGGDPSGLRAAGAAAGAQPLPDPVQAALAGLDHPARQPAAMRELMAADRRSGIAGTWSGWPITTGPFGRSRNAMAILIQLAQIGLFLSCRARSRSSAWSSACGAAGAGAAGGGRSRPVTGQRLFRLQGRHPALARVAAPGAPHARRPANRLKRRAHPIMAS